MAHYRIAIINDQILGNLASDFFDEILMLIFVYPFQLIVIFLSILTTLGSLFAHFLGLFKLQHFGKIDKGLIIIHIFLFTGCKNNRF